MSQSDEEPLSLDSVFTVSTLDHLAILTAIWETILNT